MPVKTFNHKGTKDTKEKRNPFSQRRAINSFLRLCLFVVKSGAPKSSFGSFIKRIACRIVALS
jgi:hypothetical protein